MGNVSLAVQRQKKLLLLFLFTIFVPAIVLGIFGLRALEGDRYRMEQLMRREQEEAMRNIRSSLAAELQSTAEALRQLLTRAVNPGGSTPVTPDWIAVHRASRHPEIEEKLPGTVFVVGLSGEWFFVKEAFLLLPDDRIEPPGAGDEAFQRAETYEFGAQDLKRAAQNYQESVRNNDLRVRLAALNALGRCHFRLGNYSLALQAYRKLLEPQPIVRDSENTVFWLMGSLQMALCWEQVGQRREAFLVLLRAYRELIEQKWVVSTDTAEFYLRECERSLQVYCAKSKTETHCETFRNLREQKVARLAQIRRQHSIRSSLAAAVAAWSQTASPTTNRILQLPGLQEMAIAVGAVPATGQGQPENYTVAAAVVDDQTLVSRLLRSGKPALSTSQNIRARLTDSGGKILYASGPAVPRSPFLEESLGEGMPNWKITLFHDPADNPFALRTNFYISLTVLLAGLLLLGGYFTVHTVYHEMEMIRMKSDFVSLVSHEFKSPITSMRTLMERLQAGSVSSTSKMQQYFDVICGELQRLTRLINNVLDFSKIEAGRKEYYFVDTDLEELLRDLLATFEASAVQRGFTIETQIRSPLPTVKVDRDSISQAILNLLDNAMKYSLAEKHIRIEAQQDTVFLLVKVSDRGPGIREEEIPKIFAKSYRSAETARSVPGVGLGLAIVNHIMKSHGGDVMVESEIGKGSTFSLAIPISETPVNSAIRVP